MTLELLLNAAQTSLENARQCLRLGDHQLTLLHLMRAAKFTAEALYLMGRK